MKFEEKIRKTLQATTGNICAIIKEGINHNTTGGISVASDRQYYLNAMQGKSGIELIFNSRATNNAHVR